MQDNLEVQKVSIQPIELLKQAKTMLADQYWLFVGICFVGLVIGSVAPMGVLLGPMMCGIYLCYLTRGQGKQVEFGQLFKGFDYFVESLIATLIMVGVVFVVMIPWYVIFLILSAILASSDGAVAGIIGVVLLLMYVALFALMTLINMAFLFVYLLIVDKGMKAVPAVKGSLAAVKTNVGPLLIMMIVYSIIGGLTACCCYIPFFLVLPLIIGAYYLVYVDVFGLGGKPAPSA